MRSGLPPAQGRLWWWEMTQHVLREGGKLNALNAVGKPVQYLRSYPMRDDFAKNK